MKKLFITLLMLGNCMLSKAQTSSFIENFDGASVNFTSQGIPGWAIDTNYWVTGPNCWRGQYTNAANTNPVTTTSTSFVTTGNNFVLLNFDQICKIEFTDSAEIEISTNNGITWTKLDATPGTGNCIYNGTGIFISQNSKFSEGSYFDWIPGQPTAPQNSWWKHEQFNISQLAGNQSNVLVRFLLYDFSANGMGGRYGWLLDNINITSNPCETIPPTIHPDSTVYFTSGDVYNFGPFDPDLILSDNSGCISGGDLFWQVNGGVWQQFGGMFNLHDSIWIGEFGPFSVGDTVCWYASAHDCCGNVATTPTYCLLPTNCPHFPFCDNFDGVNQVWKYDAINSTGSPWQIGSPNSGSLTTTHSGSNVIGCGLTGGYSANTISIEKLIQFNFSGITNANLSFWQNRNTHPFSDGARIEYSLDSINWNLLGSTTSGNAATNWYTQILSSSSLPGWEGNSNGWVHSTFKLGDLSVIPAIMGEPTVYFRFVFTSGNYTGDGFDFDDFCVTIPCADDVGITGLISPISAVPGTSVPIIVTVENFGTNPQSNIPVSYTINNTFVINTIIAGPIAPGTPITVNLPNTPPLPAGTDTIKIYTSLNNDCNLINDTLLLIVPCFPIIVPTYCDDFESGNNGWVSINGPGGDSGTHWEFGTPNYSSVTGAYSGITAWDINLNTSYTNNALSYLYTPYFDFSTVVSGNISFYLSYDTESGVDGTWLEYTVDGGVAWVSLGDSINDPCGTNWYNSNISPFGYQYPAWSGLSNGWIKCSYKLCCANNIFGNINPVQFRFVFASDSAVTIDGVSMDDFCIFSTVGDDVGISSITSPVGGATIGTDVNVIATLENYGSSVITSVPIEYTVNPGNFIRDTVWTGSLAPCQTSSVTLPTFNVPAGILNITAYTQLISDAQKSNDTSFTTLFGHPIMIINNLISYSNHFDTINNGWYSSFRVGHAPNTIWELGTPNFGSTTGAYSPANAWDVNLNSAPEGNAYTTLATPYFDFSQAQGAELKFMQNRKIDPLGDQFYIEYALNGTDNWSRLDVHNSEQTLNWYNNSGFWNDSSGGWIASVFNNIDLETGTGSLIQFRFVYTSDQFTTADGVSIDDFEIDVPFALALSPPSNNNYDFGLSQNRPNPSSTLTDFEYIIPAPGEVSISIVDIYGQVTNLFTSPHQPSGKHTFELNTVNYASGIYTYTLNYNGRKVSKRMVIAK